MKKAISLFWCFCISLVFTIALNAQAVTKANIISSQNLTTQTKGKYTIKTVQLSQLSKGVNTIQFSDSKSLEVNYVSGKVSKVFMTKGRGSSRLPVTNFGVKAAFHCGEGSCSCHGDDDCNDMFSSDVCKMLGPIVVDGVCVGSSCVCNMKTQ